MRIGRTPWEWRALVWVEMVGLLRLWRLRHGGKVFTLGLLARNIHLWLRRPRHLLLRWRGR
jgi:hypothetical protein